MTTTRFRIMKKRKAAEEEPEKDETVNDNFHDDDHNSRPKKAKSSKHKETNEVMIHATSDGEKYVELGKKRRATVRTFKGMIMVDIREFYGDEGDEKPGKKGISLSVEQWEALRSNADVIDSLIAAHKTK